MTCDSAHKNWIDFHTQLLNILNISFNVTHTKNVINIRIFKKKEIINLFLKVKSLSLLKLERKWGKIEELLEYM